MTHYIQKVTSSSPAFDVLEVLPLTELREQVNLRAAGSPPSNRWDAYLTRLARVALAYAEEVCQSSFGVHAFQLVGTDWETTYKLLPAPVIEVESVSYYDYAGTVDPIVMVNETNYYVEFLGDRKGSIVHMSGSMPRLKVGFNNVLIDFTAGLAPENVPDNVKHACYLIVGNYFENREEAVVGTIVSRLPIGVADLLQSTRRELGV